MYRKTNQGIKYDFEVLLTVLKSIGIASNPLGLAKILNGIGLIYHIREDFREALEIYQELIDIQKNSWFQVLKVKVTLT